MEGCCWPGGVCTAPCSKGMLALPAWDAGKATGSHLGDLPASRSPSGCSRDTKNYGPSDAVGLIDHGKGWHWRQRLVTCRERSGWVTGDFVVRTSPARTIFCSPLNSSGGGEFSLDLLQCIQQRRGKKSLLSVCLPVRHPSGVGSAPQPAPAVSASPGRSSRIDSSVFFHCSTPGKELFLSSPFTAPGFPTCAKGWEGY